MKNMSLRGLDDETARRLKTEARRAGKSVNALVVDLVRQGVGTGPRPGRRVSYRDLDALAGTWSREESERFLKAVAVFEKVDKDLWS